MGSSFESGEASLLRLDAALNENRPVVLDDPSGLARTPSAAACRAYCDHAVERVRFYYDVVCPYSYMESHAVEAREDEGRAAVEWLPFELRPAPRPLLEPRGDHLRVDWTRNVYARAQALGVEIHLPRGPLSRRSTLPLAACLWARGGEVSCGSSSTPSTEAFFCEGEDIATDREDRARRRACRTRPSRGSRCRI